MLEKGADDYNWAMENAADEGHIDVVSLMLKLGASAFDRATNVARRYGHQDIVDLIRVYSEGKLKL